MDDRPIPGERAPDIPQAAPPEAAPDADDRRPGIGPVLVTGLVVIIVGLGLGALLGVVGFVLLGAVVLALVVGGVGVAIARHRRRRT